MIAQVLLPAGLAFIMFALGLKLGWRDFAAVVAMPRALLTGLGVQLVMLPALAALILRVWPLPADLAIGLMVLSACPGGITSNLLTALAKGDTALSISMTALSTLTSLVTIPLVAAGALAVYADGAAPAGIEMWGLLRGVLVVATVPVGLGIALRQRAPRRADAVARWARPVATAIFAAVVIATFASQWTVMTGSIAALGPAVLALNAGIMALGFVAAKVSKLASAQVLAIMIEGGLRNAALGILVSVSLLDRAAMSVPSIVYALVMNITVLALVAAARRRNTPATGEGGAAMADPVV